MKKAIIIIVSVLVLAAGTFAGLFFFTDIFKPSSNNFSAQLKKLAGADVEEAKYSDYEAQINKLKMDSSYTTDANISMNLSLPNSVLDYSTQKMINSSSIKYSGSYDAKTKAMANTLGLSYDNDEMLTISTILKDQSLSIGCTELYDKNLTFDMSKYESFCQANNIEIDKETVSTLESLSKMKDIDTANLYYDLLYLSEEDYNSLNKNYGDLLTDLIDKENYETKKNQKVSVDGEEVKTTAYSLTLNGEDAYEFTKKYIELIQKDDTFKKVITDKYDVLRNYISSYGEAMGEDFSSELPELKTSEIDSELTKLLEDLEDAKDEFTDIKNAIKLTIYSNKKSEPVKFEIAILEDKDDEEGSVIFTEELSKGKNVYTFDLKELGDLVDVPSESTNSSATTDITSVSNSVSSILNTLSEITIEDKYETDKNSRKGTITIAAKASGEKQDLLTIEYENINSESQLKSSMSLSSPLLSAASLDYTYDITGLNTDKQNYKFDFSGKYSAYSIKLSMNGSMTTGKSDIPELTSSNSVDIFASSMEDLEKVYTDVITKAADTLPAKLSKYGVTVTKEEILSSLPQQTPEITDPTTTTPDGTTSTTDPYAALTEEQKKQIEQAQQQAQQQLDNMQLTDEQKKQLEQAQQQVQQQLNKMQ